MLKWKSLDSLLTFASIVQKEAASVDTMTLVASVFWNRYNNQDIFPLLQSDPTSNYANDVIKPHMEVYDETIIDAYDTYKGAGLPPELSATRVLRRLLLFWLTSSRHTSTLLQTLIQDRHISQRHLKNMKLIRL